MNGGKRATEKHKEAMYRMRRVSEKIRTRTQREGKRADVDDDVKKIRDIVRTRTNSNILYTYINVYRKFFTMFESLSFSSVCQAISGVFSLSSLAVYSFSLFIPFIYSHPSFLRLHTY